MWLKCSMNLSSFRARWMIILSCVSYRCRHILLGATMVTTRTLRSDGHGATEILSEIPIG